jgi:transcriptional regulator with XRE-family HTH domain
MKALAPLPNARSFGEFLFQARSSRGLSLRHLAEMTAVAASLLSEFENARRPPPSGPVVARLAQALELPPNDARLLLTLASQERRGIGLRVTRSTPRHVADLLRYIACMGQELSPAQVRSIRRTLDLEVAMK